MGAQQCGFTACDPLPRGQLENDNGTIRKEFAHAAFHEGIENLILMMLLGSRDQDVDGSCCFMHGTTRTPI